MDTLTINATADFYLRTLDETRAELWAVLCSMTTGEKITSEMGDTIAGLCGALRWLRESAFADPEAFAETTFRAAPAPIPSERVDYSDLPDAWALHAPDGEDFDLDESYDRAA